MLGRARILCISFSDISADARVLRQIDVLAEYGDVTTLGFGPTPSRAAEHIRLDESLPSLPQSVLGVIALALRRFAPAELAAPALRAARSALDGRSFDLVVANEARALPLAHAVADGAPVWGDMHEWAPEERTHVLSWRLLVAPFMRHICAKFLPLTAAVTTVNRSIAELYDESFGVATEVVRNAIPLRDLRPSAAEPGLVRLVHSGGAVPGRNLEVLIDAVRLLGDGVSLDFYLVGARDGGAYLTALKARANGLDRVRFNPPVDPERLPAVLNEYDVGVFILPPQTTNHRLMLPNKFFDFVQARLALIFSPAVETTALIDEHELGLVTADFSAESLAHSVRSLTPERVRSFKENSDRAASVLGSENDERVARGIVERLLRTPRLDG